MKKILIVDDAPFILKTTNRILSENYETVCASSGTEAMSLFDKEKPDLVLSELILPEMTGLELQRRLSAQYNERIPFMFMTGDEREESEALSLEAGALDYIRKPFKPAVLLRRVSNIMRQVDAMRQIQGLKVVAETDLMTGLLNKTTTHRLLSELCPRESGVLMMIDLDNFKLVNDLYGHDMGDRVLIRFADILRSIIRSSDIAGRVGGDEFLIFCRDIRDEHLISEKAQAINVNLLASAKEFMGAEMNIPLGASVGAVIVPDEGTDFDALYKKADKALYTVKQTGKHGYAIFHDQESHGAAAGSHDHSASLSDARKILEERNRQKGAYDLSLEEFRTVYRFIVRSLETYHNEAEFLVFSFASDVSGETVDAFGTLLRQTLRRSDICARSGNSQYMVVLFPQPIPDHGSAAIARISQSWEALALGAQYTCEHEPVVYEK